MPKVKCELCNARRIRKPHYTGPFFCQACRSLGPPEGWRCSATTSRTGKRCGQWALTENGECPHHRREVVAKT